MTVSLRSCRRSLLISAALLVAVALVVAAGVIPPVKADTFALAGPHSAAGGFWVNVVISLLAATVLLIIAVRTTGRSRAWTTVLGALAFFVLLLGLALVDAAFAFRAHGEAMRVVPRLLFLCSAGDVLAAVLIIATAFLLPKQT
jgi:hypothetical protein